MADAIGRTLWRLLVSGRRRLEWVSAYQVARGNPSAAQVARQMWAAPAVAIAVLVLVAVLSPMRLPLALPIIVLWMVSPFVAFMTGQPVSHVRQVPGADERAQLRRAARVAVFRPAAGVLARPRQHQEDRKS
jgi:cyclic beta-1,2-glucan synthetase